jgi:hypothetical protein
MCTVSVHVSAVHHLLSGKAGNASFGNERHQLPGGEHPRDGSIDINVRG